MDIKNILKSKGKSLTNERLEIFSFIEEKHIFSAWDILNNFNDISRASVFRTINMFLEIWIIRRISLGNKLEQYELNHEGHNHHEHMKCEACECVISFDSNSVCLKLFQEAKKLWFSISEHSISIFWKCNNCI